MPIWPYLFCLVSPGTLLYLITAGNPSLATHLPPLSSLFDTLTRQRRALQGVPSQRRSGAIDEFLYFYSYFGFSLRKASPAFLSSILMPPPAIFATRPQRPREVVSNRDPDRDTLRASVLDVALELGIGTSRAVESLIFDSVQEEDEEVSVVPARHFPWFLLVYLYIPRRSRTSVLHLERKLSEVFTSMTPCQPIGDNAVQLFVPSTLSAPVRVVVAPSIAI